MKRSTVSNQGKGRLINKASNENGFKVFAWNGVNIPVQTDGTTDFLSDHVAVNAAGTPNQVFIDGDRIRFTLDPKYPLSEPWNSESDYNYRSEIAERPWPVNHPTGTECWYGFDYQFGDDFVPDSTSAWVMHQVHNSIAGTSPILALDVARGFNEETGAVGEIVGVNSANTTKTGGTDPFNTYFRTGLFPQAGQKFKIVVQAIYDFEPNAVWRVWFDGVLMIESFRQNVQDNFSVGGNFKTGVYYSDWRELNKVNESLNVGVKSISSSVGTVRIITYRPDQPIVRLGNEYSRVVPR